MHILHRLAVGIDEAVIDGDQLQIVLARLVGDRRAELHIRRADDKTLGILRRKIINRRQHPIAIGRADFHQVKTVFLRRFVGKFPFELEPRFFRLLDDKAKLDFGRRSRRCWNLNPSFASRFCYIRWRSPMSP